MCCVYCMSPTQRVGLYAIKYPFHGKITHRQLNTYKTVARVIRYAYIILYPVHTRYMVYTYTYFVFPFIYNIIIDVNTILLFIKRIKR